MAGDPELVIPVRMDIDKAINQLSKLGAKGKQSGDDINKGFKTGKAGADEYGKSVADLLKAQIGLSTAKEAAAAIGAEYARAAGRVKEMALAFADVRQAMQQVAALKGAQNNDDFALGEVKKASEASLTPEKWRTFQEQFQSYGGAYIEGETSRFKGQEGMTSSQQAEAYQQHIAKFAQARGINADEAAQLGGGLLQFSKGPKKVEEFEAQYGKVFKTLERAPTPVSQLLPQMSRVMAQGASPEEASEMLAIMSEAMPGEEETGVTSALKAIRDQTQEGKGAALGQKEGMTPLEQVKAATSKIKERTEKGEKLDDILTEVAPDVRERKALRGFLDRGLEAKGFERIEKYQKETPDDFVTTANDDYDKSDAGKAAKRDADEALAKAERGKHHQPVEAELQEARTKLTREGYFEETHHAYNALGKITGVATGVDVDQQAINQRALDDIRAKGRAAGVTLPGYEGMNPEDGKLSASVHSQEAVNKEIAEWLKQIAEHTKKGAETADKKPDGADKKTSPSPKPLALTPPPPPPRM